jgi:phage terminase large subunit-like protein
MTELDELPPKVVLAMALEEKARRKRENRLAEYAPYPKQREFHVAGADLSVRERLLKAGNQLGKTLCAAFETAMHLTGLYPEWWDGAVFDGPTTGWVASETSQGTRDTVQRLLLGPVGAWGTGAIPADRILEIKRATHGVADAVETILVRHETGGTSRVSLKTYDQGRQRWQGETLDFVWFDEEPPLDIYTEGLTRTNATQGIVWITFTPLLGMSDVVKRYLIEKVAGTHVTTMTIYDALHYTDEQRKAIIASYPAHEREARSMGVPTLGSGKIYPIDENSIKVKAFQIPDHWPRIAGIDFGWTHPTAGAWIAHDRDTDTIYVYDAYRVKEQTPEVHSVAFRGRGVWIPVAWPHDGENTTAAGAGKPLAEQYRKAGVNMLRERATHPPKAGEEEGKGGNSVEAGIMDILDRMQAGQFKVFEHLNDWFEELRMYHREDGKIVKTDDDLLDSTRYAVMMLRHAKLPQPKRRATSTWEPKDMGAGW